MLRPAWTAWWASILSGWVMNRNDVKCQFSTIMWIGPKQRGIKRWDEMMSQCLLKKKRVENRLIQSSNSLNLQSTRFWWFLWCFFSFSRMHSGLLQRLQTHWHPNVCLSWCNGRVWGLTTNFFEFYSFTLQIHIQINWSLQIFIDFSPANLDDVDGFWVIFRVFLWETYTMSI